MILVLSLDSPQNAPTLLIFAEKMKEREFAVENGPSIVRTNSIRTPAIQSDYLHIGDQIGIGRQEHRPALERLCLMPGCREEEEGSCMQP